MNKTLSDLLLDQGLDSIYERMAKNKPEFRSTVKAQRCRSWSYVGDWIKLSKTYEFITKLGRIYRVGLAQGTYHIYIQGDCGSWEYVRPESRVWTKFGEKLGEILLRADESAKRGKYQWLA